MGTFRDYRRELTVVENSIGNVPTISREPPSAPLAQIAPWATEDSMMPSTATLPPARSFFDDGDDNLPSPPFRPETARTDTSRMTDALWYGDERRPSEASTTTIGSQDSSIKAAASKGSNKKKAAGIFGEDAGGRSPQRGSDASIPASPYSIRKRNNSVQTSSNDRRGASPASSRPITPVPSSDVVPWMFQDPNVSSAARSACVTQSVHVCMQMMAASCKNG